MKGLAEEEGEKWEIALGMQEWSVIIGRREAGAKRDGRDFREGSRARGLEEVGVRMSL